MDRPLFRKPKRITITIPHTVYGLLLDRSNREGRSISNLAAHLLEKSLSGSPQGNDPGVRAPAEPRGPAIAADPGLIP